ncbi:MAG TPA: MBL fold metallo-hydrolase [Vicinamibacterales bacterium]|nr:MBL fold metallo-hydrolase [Vicinamibacterales bacterium]
MKPLITRYRATAGAGLVAIAIAIALTGVTERAVAQQPAADSLDVVQLRPNFHVIAGAGGNIVVQLGPDGAILVDSGSTDKVEVVLAAIRKLTPLPIRYIINTSMDADHVGGNDRLAKAGLSILPGAVAAGAGLNDDLVSNSGRASVLAHENVLTRMTAATGPQALPFAHFPTKTFAFRQYSMYLNGEGIQVIHMPAAHTDGDTIVFFRRGDVIATGDIIDTTRWPFIDVKRGGSVQGELDALNRLMDMSILNVPLQWHPDRTLLVPGHGFVYDKFELLEYRDAVTVVRDRVQNLIDEGKTLAQVKAADPTLGYKSQYGADKGAWTTDMFVETVYNELAANKGKKE